jgi:hypothetical protein
MIPVDLDPDSRRLLWLDLDRYHCYEGFFHRSLHLIEVIDKIKGRPSRVFTSDLGALGSKGILTEHLYPTGFIFHGGRAGSTLLVKALARSRANLVLGEAGPFVQILKVLTDSWRRAAGAEPSDDLLFRQLVLAMGRRRLADHRAYLIKFTSFNLFFYDYIRRIFPDVPALFLYREPRAVLVSMLDNPPGWLNSSEERLRALITGVSPGDQRSAEPAVCAERALTHLYSAALQAGARGLKYLDYRQLTEDRLPAILRFFNLTASPEESRLMRTQFRYYSKSDYGARIHNDGQRAEEPNSGSEPRAGAEGELGRLYQELTRSASNLFIT